MKIINTRIELVTEPGLSVYNLTPKIKGIVDSGSIDNGIALVFTKHTTTAVFINEHEDRLLEDFKIHLENIASKNKKYLHDDIELRDCPPDERLNGHAHLKALFLNSSETIPIIDSQLALGKWQSIFFLELDGSRNREIIVQLIGNKKK
ncbi:YjbQ family protein [Candidatus Woesearchaeota archaeon]|nr:YjbQ family protein [Candidatus Woesearchaeota archaeon]